MYRKPNRRAGPAKKAAANGFESDSGVVSWVSGSVHDDVSDWDRKPPAPAVLREQNNRLRTIYEDGGMQFGRDAQTPAELERKRQVALRVRNEQLLKTFKTIALASDVDLVFVVDATGSMQPHIEGVKDAIHDIVSNLKAAQGGKAAASLVRRLRLGLVAYRDFEDDPQYEVLRFIESVDKFYSFCSALDAFGGGDFPEDVLGGLGKALELNWSPVNNTKVIFHIGDAPAHGEEFYGYHCEDDYPHGDPNGLTAEWIFDELAVRGIDYYFGKITGETDTMIGVFGDALGEPVHQFDVEDVQQILTSVISAVSTSLCHSMRKTGPSARPERDYRLDATIPRSWARHPVQSGTFIAYEFPQSIRDVVDDVAAEPFAKGAERIAFYGRDVRSSQDIVLKEYIHLSSAAESARRHEFANQLQTTASYFAAIFMADCEHKMNPRMIPANLEFLAMKTLALGTPPDLRYMSCEQRLNPKARYIRFTNNSKYVMPTISLLFEGISAEQLGFIVAFSHYTYAATHGKLMVVDLQGAVKPGVRGGRPTVQLTDPAIHCEDRTRFGSTNLSTKGMGLFFETHVCNKFCAALELPKVNAAKLLKA